MYLKDDMGLFNPDLRKQWIRQKYPKKIALEWLYYNVRKKGLIEDFVSN